MESKWVILMFMGWGLAVAGAASVESEARKTLLILGDSLTAGYGLEPSQAYPALLQKKIDDAGLRFEVVNAGVSGDTTAGGLRRLGWVLKRRVDVAVVALGGNDGLRGLAPEATRSNLMAIVDGLRAKNPSMQVVLAGMQMPPNLGKEYVDKFRSLYPAVAKEKQVTLIPHLLEGVGGNPRLNQPDQIHPTAEGQEILASNVWSVIEPVLRGGEPKGIRRGSP